MLVNKVPKYKYFENTCVIHLTDCKHFQVSWLLISELLYCAIITNTVKEIGVLFYIVPWTFLW